MKTYNFQLPSDAYIIWVLISGQICSTYHRTRKPVNSNDIHQQLVYLNLKNSVRNQIFHDIPQYITIVHL
jgi:hypothetical protein